MSATVRFEIDSPTYGKFTVMVPARFADQILSRRWQIKGNTNKNWGKYYRVQGQFLIDGKWKVITLHRYIWNLAGRPPAKQIDHVDRNTMNNAEDNLRDGTVGNCLNTGLSVANKTGFKGVRWDGCRWVAVIAAGGKRTHLGTFKDSADAVVARDLAAAKLHGEFAVLNGMG